MGKKKKIERGVIVHEKKDSEKRKFKKEIKKQKVGAEERDIERRKKIKE